MPTQKKDTLDELFISAEQLEQTSDQLVSVMDDQIDAIILSDAGKINELTEVHTDLRGKFKMQEKAFIALLTELINPEFTRLSVRLSSLKKIFPASATQINFWKEKLTKNTKLLQLKHSQVLQLLEFAINRNANMISGIYSMYNESNSHYSERGEKKGMTAGLTINQEV